MKRADDFAAFDNISAYVIINPRGEHVATIRAHFGSAVTVTVYDGGEVKTEKRGGGNYDRFTSALHGMSIDGHIISDDCAVHLEAPERGFWKQNDKIPAGYRLANYDSEKGGFFDCYKRGGLRYLQDLGYQVIQAA